MENSVEKACQDRYFVFVSDVNDFVEVRSKSEYLFYRDLLSEHGVEYRESKLEIRHGTVHSIWPLG